MKFLYIIAYFIIAQLFFVTIYFIFLSQDRSAAAIHFIYTIVTLVAITLITLNRTKNQNHN
jgi:heme/copper-type cytochrome/quinol oxidase subunit 4